MQLKFFKFSLLLFWALPVLGIHGQDSFISYKVKRGDTVSEILIRRRLLPLWGQNNYIAQTIKLNPEIAKTSGNVIYPNQIIILPLLHSPLKGELEGKSIASENGGDIIGPVQKAVNSTSDETSIGQVKAPPSAWGRLTPSYEFFYTGLSIKDKTTSDEAQIFSRVNNAFQLAWGQQWDSRNLTFLFYRSEKHDYESVEGRLPGRAYNLQGLGIGYKRSLTSFFDLQFKYQAQERLFLRATSVTELVMERAMIQELESSFRYTLLTKGPLSLIADAGLAYLLPADNVNYTIKGGQRYTGGLAIKHDVGDFSLLGRYFYSMENQDTSIITKTTKATGINVGIAWSFDK